MQLKPDEKIVKVIINIKICIIKLIISKIKLNKFNFKDKLNTSLFLQLMYIFLLFLEKIAYTISIFSSVFKIFLVISKLFTSHVSKLI